MLENNPRRTSCKQYFLPLVKDQRYGWWRNFFDQSIKNDKKPYDNVQKIGGDGDDYTAGCLLGYVYSKSYYRMIAINLSKQQALDADTKAMQ